MNEKWRSGVLYLAGAVGKLAYFGACLAVCFGGGAGTTLLAFSFLDVIFAAFFAYVVLAPRARQAVAV